MCGYVCVWVEGDRGWGQAVGWPNTTHAFWLCALFSFVSTECLCCIVLSVLTNVLCVLLRVTLFLTLSHSLSLLLLIVTLL